MKAFAVVISGLFLAAAAQASDTNASENGQQPATTAEQPASSNEQQAEDDSERRICRRIEENTGSRTSGRRVCLTAEQWRNYRARF